MYGLGREPISGVADFPHTLGYSANVHPKSCGQRDKALRVVGGAGLQHLAHVPPVHADEVDRAVRAVRSEIGKGEDKKTVNGPVTATVARRGAPGKMADDDLVCPPPIPARDQISCCYPDQLSVRRRGT